MFQIDDASQMRSHGLKLISRQIHLNCTKVYFSNDVIMCLCSQMEVTLVDVFDESALSQSVKEEMYKCYPNARLAHLKTGGNFPFLSRADEVNMYIQVSVFFWVKFYIFTIMQLDINNKLFV